MPNPAARYTLTQLADLAGVTPRTVRYYITQGLLPAPGTAGPGPKYDDTDLARLRLIKRLQRDHQPLAEIRAQLARLSDAAVLDLVATPEPPKDSALDYIRRVTAHRVGESRSLLKRVEPGPLPAAPPSIAPTAPAAPVSDAPAEPRIERSTWERIELGPDVELHVRRPLPRLTAKRVDRIVAIARDLLEEEPS